MKLQAVKDYLNGEGSYETLKEKYKLRSSTQLKNWVMWYNGHKEFKAHIYTDNIDGEISYKDLSTGQKKTLDMAIIFGILQNLIANVDFNIMFLDELFANLDTDARNVMLIVLTESLANERCVFVINHAEMADDFFNHKIRVRLVNKNVTLSKKKLKKAVDTGSDKIVARATTFEVIHF